MSRDLSYRARYQPIVDLATGRTVAQAASLHARAGDREVAPAELFGGVGDAEIARLDRLGREAAIRGAAGWLGDQRLFVRLLPEMVSRPHEALAGLDVLAAEAGVPMRQIVVEVGLTPGRDAMAHLARVVTRCRGAGCAVCVVDLDDEDAVRYAALTLAPDFLKLGRALTAGAPDTGVRVGLRDEIATARAGGLLVIAFGVEDSEQARRAARLGADWAQGYHYGRPRDPQA